MERIEMEVIRIHTPSEEKAAQLLSSLEKSFAVVSLDGDRSTVGLSPDTDTATKLVALFDALGQWLTDTGLVSCEASFGERSYTLLARRDGRANDPTAFLLERTIQLQTALDSRIVIEQAKGVLAERHKITPDDAFKAIRRDARSRRIKLRDVAASIVASVPAVERQQ
jgi:ANTAR domain